MWGLAAAGLAAAVLGALLYRRTGRGILLTLAITGGTVFYHLGFRLAVGGLFERLPGNRADWIGRRWFRPRPWEAPLYEALGVRRWKNRLPTYRPAAFSPREYTWEEIAGAMCQAELVHEVHVPLSFLPVLAIPWLGAAEAFWITSLLAAAFDLVFVVVQRYNRPRIMKLIRRAEAAGSREQRKMDRRS